MPRTSKTYGISEKLEYLGLDIDNIPNAIKNVKPLKFRIPKVYDEKQYKQYRYIPIKDIQILLTPTNRLDPIEEKYEKASPLIDYLDNKSEENFIKHTTFLNMLRKVNVEDIEKVAEEQANLNKKIPFKVKYEGNYLWQIYYSETTDQYFMLVPTEDTDYSTFFFLLKKQLEKRRTGKIFVPVRNVEYSNQLLRKSEFEDIENYMWLFTKDWPLVYEVYDKNENLSINIIGETEVYQKIKSPYRIRLEDSIKTNQFYKLLKAMFILQTELPHYFEFKTNINKNGEIEFYIEDRKIEYLDIASWINKEYHVGEEKEDSTEELIEKNKERLEKLKAEIAMQEIEYLAKEKQISTFLECKKTFFGKFKYFFKYNKKNKKKNEESSINYKDDLNDDNILTGSLSEILKARRKQKEKKFAMREKQAELEKNYSELSDKENRNLKLKKNCTIEEVIESYRELQKIENELKNVVMDINAIKLKNKNMAKKIENATKFIEEIDNHKRSIFEFWKYSNKDEISVLPEGEEEEVGIVKKIEKVFDYSEDFEQFAKDLDRMQRKVLTSEEMDGIYISTTRTLPLLNKLITNTVIPKDIETELKELKKELKEEESGLTEEFDIFDNIIEEDSKTKKIGNQKYRETSRNKFEILEINKMTKQLGFKITLEKIIQIIKDGFESVKAPEDAIIYKAINDEKIDENEFNTFNLNPQEEIIEACNKEGKEINLYKINLKKGDSVIGFTNIIYCNNKNKTLPVGMDFSNKVMIELTKFEKKFKKSNTFHIAKFEDENNDFSKLIIKDVIVYEEK